MWPGFGWVGQKKKNGEAVATGLAWPGLAGVGLGQNWKGKAKKQMVCFAWPGKVMAGRGQNWQVKPCKEFISRKFEVWHALQLIALARPPGAGWGQKLVKLAKEPRPAWPGRHYHVNFNNNL